MVALMLKGIVAAEIDEIRRGLGVRALERIGPHVTVVPPLDVPIGLLEEATGVLRRAAAASSPVQLELGPARTFFPRAPVIYLEVGGDLEEVTQLRAALTFGVLAEHRLKYERPFVPHVTLDRRMAPDRIQSALRSVSSYHATAMIDVLTLLVLDRAKPRWEVAQETCLGSPFVEDGAELDIEL